MQQEFIPINQLMESGIDLVSPHLRWLLRHAIVEHCGDKAINLISYCKDIPVNASGKPIWAETFAPCRSIAINLEAHFDHAISQIQDDQKMCTSLRTILIRELLDSAIHEAHHLKASFISGDFSNSRLEEDEAKKEAWAKSWMAAKHWDTEIVNFGSVLDNLLKDFFSTLKADTKEKPTMWKDLQVYMWERGLAFYNPDKDQECKMREAFETMAGDDDPWIDEPKMFMVNIEKASSTLVDQEEADAINPENIQDAAPTPADNSEEFVPPSMAELVDSIPPGLAQAQTATAFTYEQMLSAGWTNETLAANPLYAHLIPVAAPPAPPAPAPPAPPAPTIPAPPAPTPANGVNVQQIQRTVENVMRVLFVHVMTKCGLTHEGTFNNPTAVLEPINIANIPGATDLLSHMDTADANGIYAGNQPCNGFVKGLVSKQDLPMYRFYLNIGGNLYRRTLIPQNPNKLNANQELTKWAQEARQGAKIMMLLEDGKGPRAHIKLDAGQPLGQEEFKIWGDRKDTHS